MKLLEIYHQLTEIGDTSELPEFTLIELREYESLYEFMFEGDKYFIDIILTAKDADKFAIAINFDIGGSYDMTNKNKAIQVMKYIMGTIEKFLTDYAKKFKCTQLMYIKYNPQKEKDEVGNRRDTLYRYYISKYAKRHGSNVTFSGVGGTAATFDPPLQLK